MVNPLREPVKRLIERSHAARHVFVLTVWPFTYVADRLRGIDPPASLRRGLAWARGEHEPTIPTSSDPAVVRRPNRKG